MKLLKRRRLWRTGMAGVLLATVVVVPGSAQGAAAAACTMSLGAIRADGMLMRWAMDEHNWVLTQTGADPGYASFRTMALISLTRTYDTFLGTTRSGALYTVRIPLTSPMKPVLKLVRQGNWQKYETLVAERCGQSGTLLLAIDTNTSSADLYAVGHANGTATAIQSLGVVDNLQGDEAYFRLTGRPWATKPLSGE